jgi:DNA replication protein DnaC
MSDLTTKHETMQGGLIREVWEGREVPIPPKWVRDRNQLPKRYRFAVLAPETAGEYDPTVLEVAMRYAVAWPQVKAKGLWAIFTGDSGRGKTHAAAAIANEAQRLHGGTEGVSVEWLPVTCRLQELFDHRHFRRGEEYGALRRRLLGCDLLIVDDLLYAGQSAPVKEFLFGPYDDRYQKQKPIVTTMNADLTPEDWSAVDNVFNAAFRRRLQETAKGFTIVL